MNKKFLKWLVLALFTGIAFSALGRADEDFAIRLKYPKRPTYNPFADTVQLYLTFENLPKKLLFRLHDKVKETNDTWEVEFDKPLVTCPSKTCNEDCKNSHDRLQKSCSVYFFMYRHEKDKQRFIRVDVGREIYLDHEKKKIVIDGNKMQIPDKSKSFHTDLSSHITTLETNDFASYFIKGNIMRGFGLNQEVPLVKLTNHIFSGQNWLTLKSVNSPSQNKDELDLTLYLKVVPVTQNQKE